MKILVTGARGFIGSRFIRFVLPQQHVDSVVAFTRDTNSWSKRRLSEAAKYNEERKLQVVKGDLLGDISGLCEGVDVVVNFAAKTFVDHSIRDPLPFVMSNTVGTVNLLEEARKQKVKAFLQVSTDEVYGEILKGQHTEESPLQPRNPYAAAKAGADAFALSYAHSFGMWTCVTRTENNYGPWQHWQKAIPRFIGKALRNEELPIYGDGQHVRQWLHVDDHVEAINTLITDGWDGQKAQSGEVFHVAGAQELTNLELAKLLLRNLDKPESLIKFIPDYDIRPGHDRRYALSTEKIRDRLGWSPRVDLQTGMQRCCHFYAANRDWLAAVY